MKWNNVNWRRVLLFIAAPLVLLVLLITYCSRSCSHRGEPSYTEVEKDTLIPAEPNYLYGICIDSMYVEEGQIEAGQYLSTLFASKGVSPKVPTQIPNSPAPAKPPTLHKACIPDIRRRLAAFSTSTA